MSNSEEVNNHVHSNYSFSPYTPTQIVDEAIKAGIKTVGLMDHDTIAGASEFLQSAKYKGIAATVGCEIRVHLNGTNLEGKKVNNPDEANIIYIAIHGIPENQFGETEKFLQPIRKVRMKRCQDETSKLNNWLNQCKIPEIDFFNDVLPISRFNEGGTITERHICYALAKKIIQKSDANKNLISVLKDDLGLEIESKTEKFLGNKKDPHLIYDLLGVLKAQVVPHFFIPSSISECPSAYEAATFAQSINAIPAYAYLGDVTNSPTGDKKPEIFEDSFLDELIPTLKQLGFKAVTYMPPRNTREQLQRIQELCNKHDLMEISGVDINNPRQSFNCPTLLEPDYHHLCDAAWALIAHEKYANKNPIEGIFHPDNPLKDLSLRDRIKHYAMMGRKLHQSQTETEKG